MPVWWCVSGVVIDDTTSVTVARHNFSVIVLAFALVMSVCLSCYPLA